MTLIPENSKSNEGLDVFIHPKRIQIMSVIFQSEISFKELKEYIKTTDGNLISHIRALKQNGLITSRKVLSGNYPKSFYKITKKGEKEYINLFLWLERFWTK